MLQVFLQALRIKGEAMLPEDEWNHERLKGTYSVYLLNAEHTIYQGMLVSVMNVCELSAVSLMSHLEEMSNSFLSF